MKVYDLLRSKHSPNRIGFDVQRLMRTKYIIDDFQQTYFVVDSFEALLDTCYKDFGSVYADVKGQPDYEAHEIAPGDDVLHRGTVSRMEATAARVSQKLEGRGARRPRRP